MTNTYLDPFQYKAAPTGQEILSLIGNLGRITGVAQGATSLPITPNLAVALNQYDQVYIFDGANSEIVSVGSGGAAQNASSIPVSATLYAHVAGTPYCTDGVSGSLGQTIITASDEIENICQQSLLLGTRTDTLSLQTMRAAVSNNHVLVMRPINFPVQSVTSLLLNVPGSAQITFDPTQAFLDSAGQVVQFFQLIPTGSVPLGNPFQTMLNQRTRGTVTLTYTSGFAYASLPRSIKQACTWLTSELLSDRINPTGAAVQAQGKIHTQYRLLHETKGSLHSKAEEALKSFIVKAY